MKKTLIWLPALALAFLTLQCAQEAPKTEEKPAAETEAELVKRGEYLVTIGGCEDCHSPKIMTDKGPAPDPKLRLSGHPAGVPLPAITDKGMAAPGQWVLFHPMSTASVGPWGTSYAANITPDKTGIGEWSFEQFKKALTEGKSKGLDGGRMLLPPMPWVNYINMKEEDLQAIFAYLQSLPAVSNLVPSPVPPVQ
ncbi:MAG TPA: diheme cytochrome c-553 [Haliscomenobacter sp.]|uniref:diheme cytochrome c-553 n=1 Tax=Haliscomenobacter sp. TaxID=2717303 RepID=UPI002C43E33C|nr:diheme cytochrome c-553 [Haliscomenobacter sp.]HOY17141.1 diheme cytochrome c-553 [Haliscomenobacter sp.]HPH21004.1 diheme cytochrome c-553 [Haliscomenobacter sp.]